MEACKLEQKVSPAPMDFLCRKRARSNSPRKPPVSVKRHASCPVVPKLQEARPRSQQDGGLRLADLFRAKKGRRSPPGPTQDPSGGGSWIRPEERAPLLVEPVQGEGAGEASLGAPIPFRYQSLACGEPKGPTEEAPTSAGTQPAGPSEVPEPAMEPLLVAPRKQVLHPSLESLPKARAMSPLRPEPSRLFRRNFGKGAKEAEQRKRESKYVQTQPLYQDYWVKQLKAAGRKPWGQAFRVDASLSAAGLLPSSLLSAASHASQRDYSFAFWQEIPEVKSRGLLDGLSPRQRHLQEAMFEVITSEASYLRSLLVVAVHFQSFPGLQEVLTMAQLHRLFSNLPQVKDVSERFLLDLEEQLDQDVFLAGLGDMVLKHCPAFHRVYIPYVTNQMYQEQLMQQLTRENSRFLQVLRRLEEQPICQRQPLKSFLVLPFQRITRLKILLENILKLVPADSELGSSIGIAHKAVGEIVCSCNENVRLMKQTEELVMLEKRMDFAKVKSLPLISRGRWLVHEGELAQVIIPEAGLSSKPRVSVKPIHLHLFSDLLLLSHHKEDGRFLIKDYAKTSHVRAELCKAKPLGLPDCTFRLSMSQNHTGGGAELLLKAANESQRQEWISLLAGQPALQSA